MNITILVPVYNGLEFRKECLDSVLAQVYQDWTLLLGINGHPRDTAEAIIAQINHEYPDPRIQTKYFETQGKPDTMNAMVKSLPESCTHVAVLDIDDKWHPQKLAAQVPFLKDYDVVGTLCSYFGIRGGYSRIPVGDLRFFDFFSVNPLINSSVVMRKSLAHWENTWYALDDYHLWLQLKTKTDTTFYNVNGAYTMHRLHPESAFNASGKQDVHGLRNAMKGVQRTFESTKTLTIVTAFYHFEKSKHSFREYLAWMSTFLGNLRCHIVAFTNVHSAPLLRRLRPDNMTLIELEFTDFTLMQPPFGPEFWRQEWQKDPEKHIHSPELYVIWNSKFDLVHRAAQVRDTDWYAWFDIGCFRSREKYNDLREHEIQRIPTQRALHSLNPQKAIFAKMGEFSEQELRVDPEGLTYADFTRKLDGVGGQFMLPRGLVELWRNRFHETLALFQRRGRFAGKDQNLMGNMLARWKDEIELHNTEHTQRDKWFYFQTLLSTE